MGKRITTEGYHRGAKERGFKWTGKTLPKNVVTRTTWECSKGHAWEARYNNIVHNKSGCPYCAPGRGRIVTIQDYYDITMVDDRDVVWLGDELPKTTHTKTLWGCLICSNKWMATHANVKHRGSGCPLCNTFTSKYSRHLPVVNNHQASKPQIAMAGYLGGEVNWPFGRKTIDVVLPERHIAINYDCWFWHGGKEDKDAERCQLMIKEGWKVLAIKTNAIVPTQEQVEQAITNLEFENYYELVTPDWGTGPTIGQRKGQ